MIALLGTINNKSLPGSEEAPKYKELFERYRNPRPRLRRILRNINENVFKIIKSLLSINPANRPSAREAYEYSYFKDNPYSNQIVGPIKKRLAKIQTITSN